MLQRVYRIILAIPLAGDRCVRIRSRGQIMDFMIEFKAKRRIDRAVLRARYESMIASDMRKIFRLAGEEWALKYRAGQNNPLMSHYKADISSHLKMNYTKIARHYKTNYREVEQEKALTSAELSRRIDTQISKNINSRAITQSNFIISTMLEDLNDDMRTIIIEASAQGIRLTRDEIAEATKKKFIEASRGKSNIVGITEFTGMSNDTIFAEADVVNAETGKNLIKEWSATIDNVTRPMHILAEGMQVDMEDVFVVGDENLLFPGDGSNGASAGNLVNCRCVLDIVEKR